MNVELGDVQFAQLDDQQIKEITELEGKLGVTLIAYNPVTTNGFTMGTEDKSSIDAASL